MSADPSEPPGTTQPEGDVGIGELTFIGNATVLLRLGGFTILTDPNFLHRGEHAKLGGGLRSRRLKEPALTIGELPPLDFVVLSHHHGDHFDEVAARELHPDLPIITVPHAARKLRRQGFRNPIALQTWESRLISERGQRIAITSLPGKHAPDPLARVLPPVMGSLLELERDGQEPFRVYISGDTLMHDRLHEIPMRFPEIDLALLHLGGTKVLGVLLTMDAGQGVRALRLIGPRRAVPIHMDDYSVFTSGPDDFRQAVEAADLATEVSYVPRGEPFPIGVP